MEWTLYWITRLDSISVFAGAVSIVSFGGIIIAIAIASMNEWEDDGVTKQAVYWLKRSVAICVFTAIITILLPTTKQMAAIIILPKLSQSETVKEIPNDYKKIKDLAIGYLESKVKEVESE